MTTKTGNSKYRDNLAAMQPGESFFVAGAELDDLRFLYALARRSGMKVVIRSVELDEVYLAKGVRVWREN